MDTESEPDEGIVPDQYSSSRIIALDRKLSRALERGNGVNLTPNDLDLLAEIGFVELLANAKAKVLIEQSRERMRRRAVAATPGRPAPKQERPLSDEQRQSIEEAGRRRAWDAVTKPGKRKRFNQ